MHKFVSRENGEQEEAAGKIVLTEIHLQENI